MDLSPQADGERDGYRFGIELEYRLKLREGSHKYPDSQKLRDHLARLWNEAGKRVEGHISMKSGPIMGKAGGFTTWNIVDEHSMDESKNPFTFRLELVSPIFHYKDGPTWANQIKRLIDHVTKYTTPEMDETTGFHIHVSPANNRWSILDLKRIAQAIIYFDNPLKTLFPDHKYTKAFLKSILRDNHNFNSLSPEQSASSIIHSAETIDDLITVMNPPQGNVMYSQRKYAWNFTNNSNDGSVCLNPKHTIEFRSPRSTTELNLIEKWITFTVTFLHGSVSSPDNIHNEFDQTVDGLNGFLYHNRPPGGTDNCCWEKHLTRDEMERVQRGVDHHRTTED